MNYLLHPGGAKQTLLPEAEEVSSSRGRSVACVPQLSPSLYLRRAEFTGRCSGPELQTLLMRLLMKVGARSKSIPLQQLAECHRASV